MPRPSKKRLTSAFNQSGVTAGISNRTLTRRLLSLAWRFRMGCLRVLMLQLVLLTLGLSGLSLTGVAIDFLYAQVMPGARAPHWPFGWSPPARWSPMLVLLALAVGVFGLALARGVLNYLFTVKSTRLVETDVVAALRADVYAKLQRLSFRFFDANASGTIINRVTGDTRAIGNFIQQVLLQGVITALSLIVYLVYMLSIHPWLTVACLATTPLLWWTSLIFSRQVHPAYLRNRDLVDDMILKLAETVQGIQVVKGFAREPEEIARFAAANRAVRDQQQNIFWKVSLFTPTVSFFTQVNLTVLLLYGGWLVIHDQLALGTGLVVLAGLLQQFSGQVANMAGLANTAQQSLAGAQRVFEVLDAPVEIQNRPAPRRVPRARGAVQCEHVSFAYERDEPVLEDIHCDIAAGQCVAILGATGAGKSTLLSLVPRFYDPTRGCVRVDSVDVRELDLDDLRRNIGLVFQESFLFSNTVAANIAFGHPDASREQIERAAQIAAADEFIREMPGGYDAVLREGGANLSGGQRQRLAIARAVLVDPPILLLDDPTAAVDPHTEQEILGAIENAMRGRTTFMVTHRLSTLQRANLVLVLDHGRIVQMGTPQELMNRPGLYRQTAELQFAAGRGM